MENSGKTRNQVVIEEAETRGGVGGGGGESVAEAAEEVRGRGTSR